MPAAPGSEVAQAFSPVPSHGSSRSGPAVPESGPAVPGDAAYAAYAAYEDAAYEEEEPHFDDEDDRHL